MAEHLFSRRDFREVAGKSGAALIVGCFLDGSIGVLESVAAASSGERALNAWVRVTSDDKVTIVVSQAEMGQGIMSTLPAVLAEELGADWDRVHLEMSPAAEACRNPRINWQFTGNSESTTSFFELMRQVGASTREMLVSAAAERWRVAPSACFAEKGAVIHRPSRRRLSFGELAYAASQKQPPKNPPLKPQSEWKLLGKSLPRIDTPSKVDGSAIFGIDFKLPGMVYAAVRNSPVFTGKLKSFDRSSVAGFSGVILVVPVPGGIAVVASTYWEAKKALDALQVTWDEGSEANFNMSTIQDQYRQGLAGQDWLLVREVGDPDAIPHSYPTKRLEGMPAAGNMATPGPLRFSRLQSAEYESQFLPHATMEPMKATAHATTHA